MWWCGGDCRLMGKIAVRCNFTMLFLAVIGKVTSLCVLCNVQSISHFPSHLKLSALVWVPGYQCQNKRGYLAVPRFRMRRTSCAPRWVFFNLKGNSPCPNIDCDPQWRTPLRWKQSNFETVLIPSPLLREVDFFSLCLICCSKYLHCESRRLWWLSQQSGGKRTKENVAHMPRECREKQQSAVFVKSSHNVKRSLS